jgi:hypothetical protein
MFIDLKLVQLTIEKCPANDKAIDFYRYIGKREMEAIR